MLFSKAKVQATDNTVTRTILWYLASLPSSGFGQMSVGLLPRKDPETTILGGANSKAGSGKKLLSFNEYADIHQ